MSIIKSEFLQSNTDYTKCPKADRPEYAFIGRSNVGKSSLINMLTDNSRLAKVSSKPGKTKLINHFLVNEHWYLVDLPGYGWAQVSKTEREQWEKMIKDYLQYRENLLCIFVLIDSRIEPQQIDLQFLEWLGTHSVPFVIVFTKTDKLNSTKVMKAVNIYKDKLLETWEELPTIFISSAISKNGKPEILAFIAETNQTFKAGK